MTPDRWNHLQRLFDEAADLPTDALAAFLDTRCPADLRDDLRRLLDHDAAPHPALDRSAGGRAEPLARVPRSIGPYVIERLIGRGGMGAVYLAHRPDVGLRVALKLLPGAYAAPEALHRRFLAERRILARLDHPAIARLLDAGTTDEGVPYFVMEYVEGAPLTTYCDDARLTVDERLRLFCEVGTAVAYAHRRLVVHRDLKPSNVLAMSGEDDRPHVKLLDFGIAKLIDPEDGDDRFLTRTNQRVMTPEYAAPEQHAGGPVTTSTDVYQMGVLLYELLVGRRPSAEGGAIPAPPSGILTAGSPEAPAVAADRSTEAERLHRRLRGDLDAICLTALRPEPEARYASAEAFVDDVRRHLDGRPVQARPATLGYRARSVLRRHRAAAMAAALVLVALLGGLGSTLWQATVARAERDRAQLEAAKAARVVDFMLAMFASADPTEALGDSILVREVLDQAVSEADELRTEPGVQAQMLAVIGEAYLNLGAYEKAAPLLERVLGLRQRLLPPTDPALAHAFGLLGRLHEERGAYDEAERHYREAIARDQRRAPGGDVHLAHRLNDFGTLYVGRGEYPVAESLFTRAAELYTRAGDTLSVAEVLQNLAVAHLYQNEHAEAERSYRTLIDLERRRGPAGEGQLVFVTNGLAGVLREQARYEEALPLYQESLALRRRIYGEEHMNTGLGHFNLALLYKDLERYAEAQQGMETAVAVWRRALGDDHPYVGIALGGLGVLHLEQSDGPAAERVLAEALAHLRATLPEGHPRIASILSNLGDAILLQGAPARALPFHQEGLAIAKASFDDDHLQVAHARSGLGATLTGLGRYAEAEPLLQAAYDVQREKRGEEDRVTQLTRHRLADLYHARGDDAGALASDNALER